MNQKFVISGIAAAVLGAAASAYASGNEFKLPENSQAVVQKSTLSFFNLGSAEKAYDGSTDLSAVGKSDNIRTVVLSTQKGPSDKVSTSEGGVLNVHAKDVKLVHHDAKARSILLSASADDKSPIRSQTLAFENSEISGWNIKVEQLIQNKNKFPDSPVAADGHKQEISFVGSTLDGDIIHSTNSAHLSSETFAHAGPNNLTLTLENSSWSGAVRGERTEYSSTDSKPFVVKTDPLEHGTSVTLANSTWNVNGESGITSLKLEKDSIVHLRPEPAVRTNLTADEQGVKKAFLRIKTLEAADTGSKFSLDEGASLSIGTSSAKSHAFEFNSLKDVQVSLGEVDQEASTSVIASGKLNDGTKSVTAIVDQMMSSVTVGEKALEKAEYEIGEGVFSNGLTGTAVRDGSGAVTVDPGVETVNGNAATIAETTGVSLMQWRTEMNDMNKRMGELRGLEGTAGAWARTYFGRSEYGSQKTETEFQAIQVGADRLIDTGSTKVWTGAAFSYTNGDSDFSRGSGETNTYAITAYASTLFENGSFVDASIKYGRLQNKFDIAFWEAQRLEGDFKTNAWSATLETGHRFTAKNGFFVEPQLEIMYSRVEGDTYGAGHGTKINQKDVDMLIGRAGAMAGLKLPNDKGNVYVRASLLHDFDGETQTVFMRNGVRENDFRQDFGGTWYEYGVGANIFATESLRFYADFERTASGIVKTPYRWNVGARYVW